MSIQLKKAGASSSPALNGISNRSTNPQKAPTEAVVKFRSSATLLSTAAL